MGQGYWKQTPGLDTSLGKKTLRTLRGETVETQKQEKIDIIWGNVFPSSEISKPGVKTLIMSFKYFVKQNLEE